VAKGPEGPAVKGAAKGAVAGVTIGAIAGEAGIGAAIGAAAADQAKIDSFKKTYSACLEAKGYTVK
jgi:hypothetical protein